MHSPPPFAIYLTFLQASSVNGPVLSFSGDGEEEDPAVDLFANAERAGSEVEEAPAQVDDEEEEGEEGEDEPEDDFNAAWEVLDLARAIYDREIQQEEDDEVKLKLADTYIALGDVSLETGPLLAFLCLSWNRYPIFSTQRNSIKQYKTTK